MKSPSVLLVTDPSYDDARIVDVVARAGRALGPRLGVLLRDKLRPRSQVAALAARLRGETARVGASLVVHTDVALAAEVLADGLHLGGLARGAPALLAARAARRPAWLSVATHDDAEVRLAVAAGADAVLVSPIFDTPGKGPPRGTRALGDARAIAPGLAIYALGGVDAARAAACRAAGASGVAVIRAVFAAADPAFAARALHRAVAGDETSDLSAEDALD